MLAVPFAFGPMRSTGTGARTVVGIMIGVVFFLMAKMLESGGAVFDLPPVVIAWLPTALLALITTSHCGQLGFDDQCGRAAAFRARCSTTLLVVIALLLIVTALFLPFTGGEAITPDRSGAVEYIYQAAAAARRRAVLLRVLDTARPDARHARVATARRAQ